MNSSILLCSVGGVNQILSKLLQWHNQISLTLLSLLVLLNIKMVQKMALFTRQGTYLRNRGENVDKVLSPTVSFTLFCKFSILNCDLIFHLSKIQFMFFFKYILDKHSDDRIHCGEKLGLDTSIFDPEEGKVIFSIS